MLDDVTILVVPRERFGMAELSLRSIIDSTPGLKNLVYVDCASPKSTHERLARVCDEHGFRMIQVDGLLHPNRLRNIGLPYVTTDYVVLIDNDVLVSDGWLDALLRCARETGAGVVGPLYLEGDPDKPKIHMAGGELELVAGQHANTLHNRMYQLKDELFGSPVDWTRRRSGSAETHCMLIRRSYLDALGGFDPEMRTTRDHLDICLSVRKLGGTVYFEPSSIVCFCPPEPLDPRDVRFFLFRWNERDTRTTLAHFERKWNVVLESHHMNFVRKRKLKTAILLIQDQIEQLFRGKTRQLPTDYSLRAAASYVRGRSGYRRHEPPVCHDAETSAAVAAPV